LSELVVNKYININYLPTTTSIVTVFETEI
jgi:hypothetical protein